MTDGRMMRIEATFGAIEVRFPCKLAPEDVNDFEEHIAVMLRVMRRIVKDTIRQKLETQ